MTNITISAEDAKLLKHPVGPVAFRDPKGQLIGVASSWVTQEEIQIALVRKANPGAWIPSRDVLARLAAMEDA